jgi:hypothetical protein
MSFSAERVKKTGRRNWPAVPVDALMASPFLKKAAPYLKSISSGRYGVKENLNIIIIIEKCLMTLKRGAFNASAG